MRNDSLGDIESDIKNLINKIKKSKNIKCSNKSKIIPKIYLLLKILTKDCDMNDLKKSINYIFDNIYKDYVNEPVVKFKNDVKNTYKKIFIKIPSFLEILKKVIKNPKFMEEFEPLIDPLTKSVTKHICDEYGVDKLQDLTNTLSSTATKSAIKGVESGITSIPIIGSVISATRGMANLATGVAKSGNAFISFFSKKPSKEVSNIVNVVNKYDKNGGGNKIKKKKLMKKYATLISKLIKEYFKLHIQDILKENKLINKIKTKKKKKKKKKKK